jgi:YD repeat-containing protein
VKSDLNGTMLQRISYTYDAAGNRVTTTHYHGGVESTERDAYDVFHRPIAHTDALGNTTHTLYDESQGVLIRTTTDPHGIKTTVTYDPYAREAKKEMHASQQTLACQEMIYDAAGNLIEYRDHIYRDGAYQKTQSIDYSYDARNRVTRLTRANERTTCFSYTPNGQLATKTLPNGISLLYDYDPLGYLQTLTSSDGQLSLSYRHNRLGTSKVVKLP